MATKKRIDSSIKKLIIQARESGQKFADIASTFQLSVNTVKNITRYVKINEIICKPKGHRQRILNDEQVVQLRDWVDDDCQRTLIDLQKKMKETFDVDISTSSIGRYLDELHYSVKKISIVPIARNCPVTIDKRFDYCISFIALDTNSREKLLFIDETGIAVHCRSNYGRSKIGCRANLKVNSVKGRNYSVCAAMSIDGLYFYQAQSISYNTTEFIDYLKQLIDHLAVEQKINCTFIMDNVRFHRAEDVKSLVESRGHSLLFLPPYSPFLNPIENLFNQLKFHVKRKRPTTIDEVFDSIRDASNVITSDDCKSYYDHMLNYLPRCLRKEEIEN